jgi:putative ABC transport system permease protein
MIGIELIKYSLKNLWHKKGRSFLTILSIFVGIATIFIFISFGLGLYFYVQEFTTGSSVDKVLIQAKGGGAPGLDTTFKLTDGDVEVVDGALGVYEATGSYFKVVEVKQKKELKYTFIAGYDPKVPIMMESFDVDIEKGRFLKKGDYGKVLLGYNYLLDDLIFSKGYELGDKIEVMGEDMEIVGFLESIGNPQDDSQIYVTNDYLETLFPDEELSYGMIIARVDINNIDSIVERIEKDLRKYRDQEEGKEDFFVQSFVDLINSYASALNVIVGFIILIALISVVVSAVNTANTMITSVIERTKEIGVMKAIGAKNYEIFNVFLFESFFLGTLAGIIGVFLGFVITYLTGVTLDNLGWGFLSPYYSSELFIGCILFAAITGGISGAIPSYHASKTNIVDALRYE